MAKQNHSRLGFLGAGQMATALAKAWIQSGLAQTKDVLAGDPIAATRERFTSTTGAAAGADNRHVVKASDTVILAVKPQHMADVLDDIRPALTSRHLVLSIAAGVPLAQIAERLGEKTRLVRIMPNTPCLVGASATAYAAGPHASAEDIALVDRLFKAVGVALPLPEKLLDAVTGLSGSGPAYVFMMIEALSDGGVRMGLPRQEATLLAAQTILGAAKMLLETGLHAGALKDMVASPGGTTIAGLHELERGGLRGILMDAVEAATLRAAELGGR